MADDLETKRQTAQYARHIAWLRTAAPNLSDEEMDQQALQKVDEAVFGHDAKKDRAGNFIQQGLGRSWPRDGKSFQLYTPLGGKRGLGGGGEKTLERKSGARREARLTTAARIERGPNDRQRCLRRSRQSRRGR
jgi:hypothetical protein